MKSILPLSVFVALLTPCAQASELSGLPAAVNAALAHNAGLQAAGAQVRQAEAGKREASYSRWGRVDVSGSMTHGNNPVYVFGSLLEQGRFGAQNFAISSLNDPAYLTNYKGALTASVPLFTAFELSTRGKLAEFSRQQAEIRSDMTAQQLRYNVLASYLQVLSARQTGVALDERIGTGSKAIDEATKLRDRGLVLGSDYFVAESIREGLKGWRIQIQSEETRARNRLTILSGKPVDVPVARLSETVYPIPETDQLVAQALNDRPDLRIAKVGIGSAEASQFQAKSSLLPHASAFGNLQTNTNDFTSAPSNALVGLRLDVPLGDPTYGPRRARTQAELESQRRQVDAVAESVTMDVTQAAEQYRSAVLGLAAAKETRLRAAKALDLFRPLYRSGRQSVMEVLRAEEGLARAEAAYQQALLGVHVGWAQLQLSLGHLDRSAVDQIQSHLEVQP